MDQIEHVASSVFLLSLGFKQAIADVMKKIDDLAISKSRFEQI